VRLPFNGVLASIIKVGSVTVGASLVATTFTVTFTAVDVPPSLSVIVKATLRGSVLGFSVLLFLRE